MPDVILRKFVSVSEEIHHEFGPPPDRPLQRAAVMAVIRNPFAGRYVPDIQPFMEDLKPLGLEMAERVLALLGGDASKIEAYGKGSLVGTAGETEHGALWHAPGGYVMREVLGGAKAIVPSTKKVGPAGARLDVPLTHVNASYVRSHFDAMELGLNDAPRSDEMVVMLAMATGPRVHARAGGLAANDVVGKDGLR